MTTEVPMAEVTAVIEKALGEFPGSVLIAQGIAHVLRDAGFKIVRKTSTEMREEMKGGR